MIRSSLGFVFSTDLSEVLLITKQRPVAHKDKLNGLGGKCLLRETTRHCMVRELEEEAGIFIPSRSWKKYAHLKWDEWRVDIFAAVYKGAPTDIQTITTDPVAWYSTTTLPAHVVSNLRWLIPLAHDALTDEIPPVVRVNY